MIFEKEGKTLLLEEFEKITGAKWIPTLDFSDFPILHAIQKEGRKLHKKGKVPVEQLWLGKYYQKELLSPFSPDVAIRWIDPILGWGGFALRDFRKMEFIAEYSGKVRKKEKSDSKNAYCFEYVVIQEIRCPYTVDARDQGGLGRYLNHSFTPNLNSSLAMLEDISHVILYANQPIAKGAQLCYDYGSGYWSNRPAPLSL